MKLTGCKFKNAQRTYIKKNQSSSEKVNLQTEKLRRVNVDSSAVSGLIAGSIFIGIRESCKVGADKKMYSVANMVIAVNRICQTRSTTTET